MLDPSISTEPYRQGLKRDDPGPQHTQPIRESALVSREGRPDLYVFRTTRDAVVLSPGMSPKPLITCVNHEREGTVWADLRSVQPLNVL